jgi:hypothetical protein
MSSLMISEYYIYKSSFKIGIVLALFLLVVVLADLILGLVQPGVKGISVALNTPLHPLAQAHALLLLLRQVHYYLVKIRNDGLSVGVTT